jgi:hypothetical protein
MLLTDDDEADTGVVGFGLTLDFILSANGEAEADFDSSSNLASFDFSLFLESIVIWPTTWLNSCCDQ